MAFETWLYLESFIVLLFILCDLLTLSYLAIMVANSWKLMSPSLSLSAWVIILVTSASLSLSPMLAITCSSSGKLTFYNYIPNFKRLCLSLHD